MDLSRTQEYDIQQCLIRYGGKGLFSKLIVFMDIIPQFCRHKHPLIKLFSRKGSLSSKNSFENNF